MFSGGDTSREFAQTPGFSAWFETPRDVIASIKRTGWEHEPTWFHAERWRADQIDLVSMLRALGDRASFVRYEDLVQLSEKQATEFLLRRAGLGAEAPADATPGSTAQMWSEDETWKARSAGKIDSTSVSKWKTELSEDEASLIRQVCFREMCEFGYGGRHVPTETASWSGSRARYRISRAQVRVYSELLGRREAALHG